MLLSPANRVSKYNIFPNATLSGVDGLSFSVTDAMSGKGAKSFAAPPPAKAGEQPIAPITAKPETVFKTTSALYRHMGFTPSLKLKLLELDVSHVSHAQKHSVKTKDLAAHAAYQSYPALPNRDVRPTETARDC
jgi:hypothetical protein